MFPELNDPIQMEFDFIYPDDYTDPPPTSPSQKISGYIDSSQIILDALKRDFGLAQQITDEEFELAICALFENHGYTSIRPEGGSRRKDGGIDIYAFPKHHLFPFFIGVQVKQKQKTNKVSSQEIDCFHGAIHRNRLVNAGIFVTNTSYTRDAQTVAQQICNQNGSLYMRLRGNKDLWRWLHTNDAKKQDHREMPRYVEVAHGVKLAIPDPFNSTPSTKSLWTAA